MSGCSFIFLFLFYFFLFIRYICDDNIWFLVYFTLLLLISAMYQESCILSAACIFCLDEMPGLRMPCNGPKHLSSFPVLLINLKLLNFYDQYELAVRGGYEVRWGKLNCNWYQPRDDSQPSSMRVIVFGKAWQACYPGGAWRYWSPSVANGAEINDSTKSQISNAETLGCD